MTVQVSTRVDKATKQQFDNICELIGVSSSNAISMFIKAVINHNGIPFNAVASTGIPDQPVQYGRVAESPDTFWEQPRKPKMARADVFGCARGLFNIPDDFDEPLGDFKEYME